jgi:glycosyltransferase involved in cell wall biosynthesis
MGDAASAGKTSGPGKTVPRRAHRVRRRARRWYRAIRRRTHRMVRHTALRVARLVVAATLRRPPPPEPGGRLRVRFLLQYSQGGGGTIRTVLNLAGYLAAHHDVEILSVLKRGEKSFFPTDPRVRMSYARDKGVPIGRLARLLDRLPSVLVPVDDASFRSMSLYTDLHLVKALRGPGPHVLIGTRPSLNLLAAELSPRGVVTIGQDHMNLGSYRADLYREIARAYGRLTALSVLTERSLRDYRELLEGSPVRVVRIPNALPALPGGPSPREEKAILAAGRLTRQKGFDLLLAAYREVAAAHPGWTLRIFGSGPKLDRLRRLVGEYGLDGRVQLRGRTPDLPGEMDRASMYVLSSRFEGMPMVVLEAMGKGLPVVAFDCPTGPGEMIEHGRSGLLVPLGDVDGLAAALRTLIEDAEMRDRLGEAALARSRDYTVDRVGARWLSLLEELCPEVAAPAAREAAPGHPAEALTAERPPPSDQAAPSG